MIEIEKSDIEIAEFMGLAKQNRSNDSQFPLFESPETGEYILPEDLSYSASWDWLMEVVAKIEKIEFIGPSETDYCDFHIMPDAVIVSKQSDQYRPLILINKSEGKGSMEDEAVSFEDKLLSTYRAVVILIKWLNEFNCKSCKVEPKHKDDLCSGCWSDINA